MLEEGQTRRYLMSSCPARVHPALYILVMALPGPSQLSPTSRDTKGHSVWALVIPLGPSPQYKTEWSPAKSPLVASQRVSQYGDLDLVSSDLCRHDDDPAVHAGSVTRELVWRMTF